MLSQKNEKVTAPVKGISYGEVFHDEWEVTTTQHVCSIDPDMNDTFKLIHSIHPNAPPTGTFTSTNEVNLILRKIKMDETGSISREYLNGIVDGDALVSFYVAVSNAPKQIREEIKRLNESRDTCEEDSADESDGANHTYNLRSGKQLNSSR